MSLDIIPPATLRQQKRPGRMRRHTIRSGFGAVVLAGSLAACQPAANDAARTEPVHPAAAATAAAANPAQTVSPSAAGPAATKPAGLAYAHGQVADPNRRLTPGSVMISSTVSKLCTSGYTATVRDVTTATRRQVFMSYGIAYPPPTGAYELDHLIALELGGDNAATNLWPQPYHSGAGSADVKDHLENHLHALLCSGQVTLSAAQTAIAGDWWAAAAKYNPITVHTTSATTTAAPATTPATARSATPSPTATKAVENDQGTVHAGSFCSPAGATGHTSAGTSMVCGTTANSPDRTRWHRA